MKLTLEKAKELLEEARKKSTDDRWINHAIRYGKTDYYRRKKNQNHRRRKAEENKQDWVREFLHQSFHPK